MRTKQTRRIAAAPGGSPEASSAQTDLRDDSGVESAGGLHVETLERLVKSSHDQILFVRDVYKWLAGSLAVIISTGLVLAGFLYNKSISDLRSDMQRETERMNSSYQKHLDLVRDEVRARIDREFDNANVRRLVVEETKRRIDAVAVDLVSKTYSERVSPVVSDVLERYERLSSSVSVTTSQMQAILLDGRETQSQLSKDASVLRTSLAELKDTSLVMFTVLKASNDDMAALRQLEAWGQQSGLRLSDVARNAAIRVRSQYLGFSEPGWVTLEWKRAPDTLSLTEFKREVSVSPDERHAALFDAGWNSKKLTRTERLQFAFDVLTGSNSETAVHHAGKCLAKEAKLLWQPFETKPLVDWWRSRASTSATSTASSARTTGGH